MESRHKPVQVLRRTPGGQLCMEINKALAKPDVKSQLEKLGAVIVGDSPAAFTAYLKRDYDRWENVIKTAAIKLEVN